MPNNAHSRDLQTSRCAYALCHSGTRPVSEQTDMIAPCLFFKSVCSQKFGLLQLLKMENVSVEKFAPFSEIQWISNLSEGAMGEVHR